MAANPQSEGKLCSLHNAQTSQTEQPEDPRFIAWEGRAIENILYPYKTSKPRSAGPLHPRPQGVYDTVTISPQIVEVII